MRKIFFVHLLNDFSGSPKIGRQVLNILKEKNTNIYLLTSSSSNVGFLGNISGLTYKLIEYKWHRIPIFTLFKFIKAQWLTFWFVFKNATRDDLIYVNTILPVGALIAARFKKIKSVCHIHEVYDHRKSFERLLFYIITKCNPIKIFVSNFTANSIGKELKNSFVLYNCIENEFFANNLQKEKVTDKRFSVLMACSLKSYKGIYEFTKVAEITPEVDFKLIINCVEDEKKAFEEVIKLIPNLTVKFNQKNMVELMKQSDLVVNLTIPNIIIETFGLTLVEGMALGKPVIAPPVGGPTEFVENGKNGFLIDSRNTEELRRRILYLANDADHYLILSKNARQTAQRFSTSNFKNKLLEILNL